LANSTPQFPRVGFQRAASRQARTGKGGQGRDKGETGGIIALPSIPMDPSLSYKYWWNGLNRHSTNITHVKIAHRVVKYNTAG